MSFTYKYERAALTVDGVIFGLSGEELSVLLIQRKNEPFRDQWALPGGFFDMEDESAEQAAARELREETGISGLELEQFFTFSKQGRDPRGRTISIAYSAVVERKSLNPVAADDAKAVQWITVAELGDLAFDHAEIISTALDAMRRPGSRLEKGSPGVCDWLRGVRLSVEEVSDD